MLIYNTTFHIEVDILDQSISNIEKQLIPKLLETGYFKKAIFSQILGHDTPEAKTYSLQLFCSSQSELSTYKLSYGHLFTEFAQSYTNKLLFFQTEMNIVSVNE